MRNQEELLPDVDLHSVIQYGCGQLDILEESNKLLLNKLRAGDFTNLPALLSQRNLLENHLISFKKNLLALVSQNAAEAKKIDPSVLTATQKFREKALHLSEAYLTIFEMIESGQKKILQRLKETRLSSKTIKSYNAVSNANHDSYFTRYKNNKGK